MLLIYSFARLAEVQLEMFPAHQMQFRTISQGIVEHPQGFDAVECFDATDVGYVISAQFQDLQFVEVIKFLDDCQLVLSEDEFNQLGEFLDILYFLYLVFCEGESDKLIEFVEERGDSFDVEIDQ